MLELEKSTFATLDTIKKLYESATSDDQKIYHLRNISSVIKSLQSFLESKVTLARGDGKGDGDVRASNTNVNVNVTSNPSATNGNGGQQPKKP